MGSLHFSVFFVRSFRSSLSFFWVRFLRLVLCALLNVLERVRRFVWLRNEGDELAKLEPKIRKESSNEKSN